MGPEGQNAKWNWDLLIFCAGNLDFHVFYHWGWDFLNATGNGMFDKDVKFRGCQTSWVSNFPGVKLPGCQTSRVSNFLGVKLRWLGLTLSH